jgi:hypothetical protein
MNKDVENINELQFEKILAGFFIVISIMNIYGDNLQQTFIKTKDRQYEKKARDIFITALIISIFIYLYFIYRNNSDLKDAMENNDNVFESQVRLFGSILILIGALCILYFQLSATTPIGSPDL